MAAITDPAPTSNRAVAIQTNQPVRLVSDTSMDWFVRTNGGGWSQFATGTLVAVWGGATSVTNRLTFDRVEIALGTAGVPDTATTRHFDLCEGPVACLWVSDQVRNEALEEPPLRPWEGEDDDPPLGVPLYMPGANRDNLGTVLCESVSEPGGPVNLVTGFRPGVFVDNAGKLGVRTAFTNDVRGLGPFPAIAAYYHGGLYFQHDFGKSRNLGLTRVLYQDASSHVAVVRGDGRRNTYRWNGASFDAAAGLQNTLVSSGGIFTETTPSGRVYRYDSAGRLQRVVDRQGQSAYYSYDANNRLQKINGLPGANALGLVPYLSYNASGLFERLVLEDSAAATNNRTTYFTYDGNRNLLRIIGPQSCITYFEYNNPLYVSAVTDPEGYRWYFGYDGSNRVERVVDARFRASYFAWDTATPMATVKDRAGKPTYFRYNAWGAPYQVTNLGSFGDYYLYDQNGNLTHSRNRLSNKWYYQYDARRNRISSTDPLLARSYFAYDATDLLRSYTDPLSRVTSLAYDGSRNRTSQSDPLGNTTYFEYESTGLLRQRKDRRKAMSYFVYDPRGNVTYFNDDLGQTSYFQYNSANERTATKDPLGRLSYVAYDKRGRVSTTISPIDGWSYFAYDARCNLIQEVDALNRYTYHKYDGNQNRIQTLSPPADDGVRTKTYFGYDVEDRVYYQFNGRNFSTYFFYDALGRRQKVRDAYGNESYFAYDTAHQLERQTNPLGNASYFQYDPTGRQNKQTNAWFNTTYFGFNLASERVVTVDPRGNGTYFEYDPRGWQRQTKSQIGAINYFAFDEEGNRERSIDPRGLTTYFTYDKLGRLTHQKDQLLGVTYTGYDRAGQAVLRLDELGAATYLGYDLAGRSQTTLDPAGLFTYLQYDKVGNLLGQVLDQGWGRAPWGSSPYGGQRTRTYFQYDGLNRRTVSIDPYNRYAYTSYDRNNNVYFQIDERRFTTYFLYDRLDRRTHTADGVTFAKTYMGYDAVGNSVVSIDQQGAPAYVTYDRLNRAYYQFDLPTGLKTYLNYDAAGNRTAQHLVVGSVLRSSYFQYDRVNRTLRQIAADGGNTYFGYDLAGNQTLVTDPMGRPTYTAYDQLNRTYCRYDAQLNKTYFNYDARSSVTREIDPEGRAVYMGYDEARRLRSQSNALGEFSYFFYDARGARTHVLNPRGYSTYFRYDLLGRQTHRQNALGGTTYLGYDEVSNQVLSSDELGQSTYLTYDGLRRLTHSKDQAAGVTYMGYDSRSSLVRRVDPNGRATYMAYDTARRLERQWHQTGVAGETNTAPSYYLYNAASELTLVDDRVGGLGVSYFDYDKVGRVTKKTTATGAVYYAYDLSGMKTSLKDPDLRENVYVYDAVGRLTHEQVAAGRTAYLAYDKAGLVTRRASPGNVVVAYYSYDAAGRLKQQENKFMSGANTLLSYFAFNRNPNGAPTWVRNEGGDSTYYQYDPLDRLTREFRLPTGTGRNYDTYYAYDPAGNRTLKVNATLSQNSYYTYDVRNLLQKEWNKDAPETTYFTYDSARRMTTQKIAGGQSSYFVYDQRDRVTVLGFSKAASPDSPQYLSYNGVNERVSLKVGTGAAEDLRLAYDGKKLLVEKNAATGGTTDRRYRHNMSVLDPIGSAVELETAAGARRYLAFGPEGTLRNFVEDAGAGEFLENAWVRDQFGVLVNTVTQVAGSSGKLQFLSPVMLDLGLSNVQVNCLGANGWLPRWGVVLLGGGAGGCALEGQVLNSGEVEGAGTAPPACPRNVPNPTRPKWWSDLFGPYVPPGWPRGWPLPYKSTVACRPPGVFGEELESCPCFVDLYFIQADSSLGSLGRLVVTVPSGRSLTHTGLKVQLPEPNAPDGDRCPVYAIELQGYVSDSPGFFDVLRAALTGKPARPTNEAGRVGQRQRGRALTPGRPQALTQGIVGFSYGIRVWRNGELEDESEALDKVRVSISCKVAKCVVENASNVPIFGYGESKHGDLWSSNSIPSYLLQRCGIDAEGVPIPGPAHVPGWDAGLRQAKAEAEGESQEPRVRIPRHS